MSVKMTTRQVGDVTVVDTEGRITLGDGATTFRDTLRDLANAGNKKLLLNLAEVSYIDSSGIGEMVSGFTTVANQGGQVKLLNLTKRVKDLLQITKLYTVFEVFDDEATAAEASTHLGPMPAQPRRDPVTVSAGRWGRVPRFDGVRTFHHHEKEAPSTTVTLATIAPYSKEPDTAATRLKYLPRSLAHAILNRRLSILARRENAPFVSGSAGVGEGFGFYRQSAVTISCRAEQWRDALGVGEQELRRALEHGFQPAELTEAVANFRNSLEQAVKTARTRRSPELADEIAESLLDRDVWTSAEDDLALYGPALA